MSKGTRNANDTVMDFNRTFNIVIWMVFGLTLFFTILAWYCGDDTRFTAFMDLAKVGFGAIVGLLGGRRIK